MNPPSSNYLTNYMLNISNTFIFGHGMLWPMQLYLLHLVILLGWRVLLKLGILKAHHQAEPGPMLPHTGMPQSTATYGAWAEGQLHTRNHSPDGQAAPD